MSGGAALQRQTLSVGLSGSDSLLEASVLLYRRAEEETLPREGKVTCAAHQARFKCCGRSRHAASVAEAGALLRGTCDDDVRLLAPLLQIASHLH